MGVLEDQEEILALADSIAHDGFWWPHSAHTRQRGGTLHLHDLLGSISITAGAPIAHRRNFRVLP